MTFAIRNGSWFAEEISLSQLAKQYGTPCYVYSQNAIESCANRVRDSFPQSAPRFFYAVKANDNLSLLRLFVKHGFAFDIVSGGELARVLAAGGAASDIVFSGVGKSVAEITQALAAGIGCFNVESADELIRIESIAKNTKSQAPIALRVTPNIDADTHPHLTTGVGTSKFGIANNDAIALAQRADASPHCDFLGFACHIGSQIRSEEKYIASVNAMCDLLVAARDANITIKHIDMGGGFAVDYESSQGLCVTLSDYDHALAKMAKQFSVPIWLEPGRSLIAPAGVLLVRVEYIKHTADAMFWIVDAGMNDLPRPSLYDAYHAIEVVSASSAPAQTGDIAGPVCESADVIGRARTLSAAADDILMIRDVGAYCAAMMSNYNSRPHPCEILVSGSNASLIRHRQTIDEMLANEKSLLD